MQPSDLESTLSHHERIAFQFSGGRDSLACLYLLKPHWDRCTVYWCDSGAAYPETVRLMDKVRDMVPHFVRIEGRQPQVVAQYGLPSDIVPVSATPLGIEFAGGGLLIQDRYSCCVRSRMIPLAERMAEDGITLVIRGQKRADKLKANGASGTVQDGIEYLFPIEDWSDRDVMNFLNKEGADIPRFYEMLSTTPECMTCTAWWEEGEMAYLKRYHHHQYLENLDRMDDINQAITGHIAAFNKEVA